jgi:hypothetical protein
MATKTSAKSAKGTVEFSTIPKLKLDMPLDARKVKEIERCLKKGRITITVGKVDLATGRLGDGWKYD